MGGQSGNNAAYRKAWAEEESFHSAPSKQESDRERTEREAREKPWFDALKSAAPKLKDDVERAYKKWNLIIRDHLRNETGLRFSQGGASSSVPVVVTDGLPRPFAEMARPFDYIAPALVRLPLLEAASNGVSFVVDFRHLTDDILRMRGEQSFTEIPRRAFTDVREYFRALLEEIERTGVLTRLLSIREDVLGAYFYRQSRIRLYWMPIGIIALARGLSVEALTVVVLAHELAHAYTHLGRDINQRQWDTSAFADADDRIVEGLAQHYTKVVCDRLSVSLPDAIRAFEKLLEHQAEPYTVFQSWVQDNKREHAGEIMRAALLAVRYSSEKDHDKFKQRLEKRSDLAGTIGNSTERG